MDMLSFRAMFGAAGHPEQTYTRTELRALQQEVTRLIAANPGVCMPVLGLLDFLPCRTEERTLRSGNSAAVVYCTRVDDGAQLVLLLEPLLELQGRIGPNLYLMVEVIAHA